VRRHSTAGRPYQQAIECVFFHSLFRRHHAIEAFKGKVMEHERGQAPTGIETANPESRGRQGADDQHLSTRGLVIVFAAIATALVLGYLLLNKLVDISQEEDCALARRYNCAAVEVPR
jgi:hypothetical protein